MKEKPKVPDSYVTDVDGVRNDGTSSHEFMMNFFIEIIEWLGFGGKLMFFTSVEVRPMPTPEMIYRQGESVKDISGGVIADDFIWTLTVNNQIVAVVLNVRTPMNYLQHLFAHYLDEDTIRRTRIGMSDYF